MLRSLVAGLALGICAAAGAQEAEPDSSAAAVKNGPLTVWVVTPGNAVERAQARVLTAQKRLAKDARPPGYSESTAGSFGKAASDVGQTAGSYGQTAGSLGTNASNVGTNAGNYGKRTDDPSISTPASQTAGSYGQTAGSFGQTSSTFGSTLGGDALGAAPAQARARPAGEVHNRDREELTAGISALLTSDSGSEKGVHIVGVAEEQLAERLRSVAGTPNYPDVLLTRTAHPLGDGSEEEVTMLGWPGFMDGGDTPPYAAPGQPQLPAWNFMRPTILVHAPHPAQARAFVVQIREVSDCPSCENARRQELIVPGRIAMSAVQSVLSGNGVGSAADDKSAKFSGATAQKLALIGAMGEDAVGDLSYAASVDKQRSLVLDKVAVIAVRAVASGPNVFALTHSLVVLRKDEAGHWKVLQVSANEGWGRRKSDLADWATLVPSPRKSAAVSEDQGYDDAKGVQLAAPVDGDTRGPVPMLWWDNLGGAALQVVEWQWKTQSGAWTDPRLMMVPDHEFRVRTQAGASFASLPGTYKWRVWSAARGGAMTFSEWRTFIVVR